MKKLLLIVSLILFVATVILLVLFIQMKLDPNIGGKLPYGTYTMAGTDSQIELRDDDTLIIRNYDLSALEKETYEDATIALRNDRRKEDDKLTAEEEREIRDAIDLDRQFLDRESMFFRVSEDDLIGLYIPVDNCDLFLYLELDAKEKTIVFDDNTFSLEKR
mgnify:CR=1 FL=1